MVRLLGHTAASIVLAWVPAPLCADAYADTKSFVEIPTIAEIDDATETVTAGIRAKRQLLSIAGYGEQLERPQWSARLFGRSSTGFLLKKWNGRMTNSCHIVGITGQSSARVMW